MNAIEKKEVLVIYNSVDFFEQEIKNRGWEISKLQKEETLAFRIIKKLIEKITIGQNFLYANWKHHLEKYKVIVLFAPVDEKTIQYIQAKNPQIKIVYWYWNPAYRIGRPTETHYNLTDLWTFDKFDAVNYKMKYNNTFYFDTIQTKPVQLKYDLAFVGRNKHRKERLLELKEFFISQNLKPYFHIVPNRNEKNPNHIKELSYSEYLEVVAQSKAILDIMPPSQVGLTLRPMESIFLRKKIISDNPHLKNEPFYNPANVFIIGEDNFEDLPQFLESPYEPISEEILKRYEFDNWMERILQDTQFTYGKV